MAGVLGLGIAFAGGLVSFASPCCLPLVPAYVGYMVGATGEGSSGRRPAFLHGLSFVAGFSLVFLAFYAFIGVLGAFISPRLLSMAGGALLVFLGLQVAGLINVRALLRDTRSMPTMGTSLVMVGNTGAGIGTLAGGGGTPAYPRSFAFGLLFAAGWSPCIGPILGGILGLATAAASAATGTLLLVSYAAGLAIPFLAVAMGASWVTTRMGWFNRHHHAVSLVTGALLVILGVLMLTNTLGRLATLGSPLGL